MNARADIEWARAKLLAYRTGSTAEGVPHQIRSLRQLAREVGMSPTGLSMFMAGTTEPYTKTILKLFKWCRSERARSGRATQQGSGPRSLSPV